MSQQSEPQPYGSGQDGPELTIDELTAARSAGSVPAPPISTDADDDRRMVRRLRRRGQLGGIVACLVIGIVIIVTGAMKSPAKTTGDGAPPPAVAVATAGQTGPPWPAPANPDQLIATAGLRLLDAEGTALHFHTHLDVIVNGQYVTVPADLGINVAEQRISEMHTHDTSGVIHIEAPDTTRQYSLGQLFAEWGVRLDAQHIGALTTGGGKTLHAYLNGVEVTGDPAAIVLRNHDEIALEYGDPASNVRIPTDYTFGPGL